MPGCIALAALLSTADARAADRRPSDAAPARPSDSISLTAAELQHKRQTQEGERSSRAMPPQPLKTLPNNGIQQIPIDTSRAFLEPKGAGRSWNDALPSDVLNGAASRTATGSVQAQPLPWPPPFTPPCFYAPGIKTASLVRVFPEVTWHVCVNDVGVKGLWVGPVDIKRTPSSPWMRVIYQAGLADIFVPYHDNSLRFYDMRWTGWLDQVFAPDAGPNGSLITLTNDTIPTVVAEVRDRGVALLCKENGTSMVRRGQEFVVWGVSDAGNYDNMVQVSFRDDGSMGFRMGNTGFNAGAPVYDPLEAHAHNALWRVDMDLNGSPGDTAYWTTHSEPYPNSSSFADAQDFTTPLGTENMAQWDYAHFSSLLIEDSATNAFGHHLGYEFVPAELGMTRHYGVTFGATEVWTHNDVYVTVYHDNEFGWLNSWASQNHFFFNPPPPPNNFVWTAPDNYLLSYVSNAESVTNNDLVVWIKSSAHHDPSDEDRSTNDLIPPLNPDSVTGVTLVHWSGFDIEPHNLFNDNPLGGPVKCG